MAEKQLFVLDDEQDFCDLIAKVAGGMGFEVFATTDAAAARERLRDSRGAVLILDLKMPHVDGIEMLRHLAEDGVDASILVASGADGRILESALGLGKERGLNMAGILPKPIRVRELRALLERISLKESKLTPEQLQEGINAGDLLLHYQPILDLKSGATTGVEALVRWQHPGRGLLMPGSFIPMAESSGVIMPLTDWVLREAILQAGRWRRDGVDLEIAVNLSAANIVDYALPDRIENFCRAENIAPERVTVELTETATMRDAVRLRDVLTRFRLKGFNLSIDDFGTGYSSLVQLQRLPFSQLKIDRSFVSKMLSSPSDAVIVRTIVGMVRNLELSAVAEGVENAEVLAALSGLECDFAQGYHISRPMKAGDLQFG